jgi:hypothetical protein
MSGADSHPFSRKGLKSGYGKLEEVDGLVAEIASMRENYEKRLKTVNQICREKVEAIEHIKMLQVQIESMKKRIEELEAPKVVEILE